MVETVDTIVIGAGVVGLAIGRRLALDGRQIIVLEKNGAIGEETSSRNSEVIHAGIYYPKDSLKATLCVAGKEQLYRYCESKGVSHARCGKVIVAVNEDQESILAGIRQRADDNGVTDLEWLDRRQMAKREPAVKAAAGLWSPSTGILDTHAYMLALQGDLENAGGMVALHAPCVAGKVHAEGVALNVVSEGETTELIANTVVNCAGLHASNVARSLPSSGRIPDTRYAKGNYFVYQGPSPFEHLVYPIPEPGGLGIHATLDLGGRARFGPDVEWVDTLDYTLDESRSASFYAAIRSYWPELADGMLGPGYVGIRPKLERPGEAPADFRIDAPIAFGKGRIVNLFGIESPGLTASLAIADLVATGLKKAG